MTVLDWIAIVGFTVTALLLVVLGAKIDSTFLVLREIVDKEEEILGELQEITSHINSND